MARAYPCQPGEGRERDVVGDMLLDIGSDLPLLPGRQTATADRRASGRVAVDANQFVRQQDAERLGVSLVYRTRVLHQRLELERDLPQVTIVKEQAGLELDLAKPQRRIGERPARIDVDVGRAHQRARRLRSAKIMSSRDESQLPREIAQGRPRQALDKSLAAVALGKLRRNE